MKTLLVALNSKYIHSAYGIYCISAYCKSKGQDIEIAEYTINNNENYVLQDIYKKKPNILGFSCYIWNIDDILRLAKNIKKIIPSIRIFLGGPEVSYEGERLLRENKEIELIVLSEGEERVYKLVEAYEHGSSISKIDGLLYRENDVIKYNEPKSYVDLDKAPFVYDYINIEGLCNKIIYYESQRGCPFRCSYCLSSVDKKMRFVSLDRVLHDLKYFLDKKIRQVKFIDRTFNCDKDRTKEIWNFLKENDNRITNFHFEISVDILDKEELEILKDLRPGYFQFEIGVQTTNEETLKLINRSMKYEKVKENVNKIKSNLNIHQHLDLIAGLPKENFESFKNSFNDVYSLQPDQLQLGFLKVLKGTQIREEADKYGIVYKEEAPYEVLYTNYINYEEMLKLKEIEEIVEIYYNSGRFGTSIKYLETLYSSAFEMYEAIVEFWAKSDYFGISHNELDLYRFLWEMYTEYRHSEGGTTEVLTRKILHQSTSQNDNEECDKLLNNILKFDMYSHTKLKKIPEWLDISKTEENRERIYNFYKNFENIEKHLLEYKSFDSKQISRMAHIEYFDYDVFEYINNSCVVKKETVVLFNYENFDKITGNAQAIKINIDKDK